MIRTVYDYNQRMKFVTEGVLGSAVNRVFNACRCGKDPEFGGNIQDMAHIESKEIGEALMEFYNNPHVTLGGSDYSPPRMVYLRDTHRQ